MNTEFFKVEKVEAGYGDIQVLWGVDMDVQEGEIVCIVGSNGAGKSTLLRCISGVIPAQSGRILMRDADLARSTPDQVLASGIALVPEGRRLFSGMSVKNNLLMGSYIRRDKQIRKDLDFVFSIFPILAERMKQDAGTLSGGEQQMCAIARGIMSRPALLMIDELSLGLAPLVVEDISKVLLNINQAGISILLVEQDVMTAFELARRGIVLESGRVTIGGFTADLANDPTVRQAYMGL
ncbi:MAG: ABC transporter ATP-binding protein [Chloroflexi bacterium]|nr:ABC transporter ATP-binding protein [Chloroflexota bacterium]